MVIRLYKTAIKTVSTPFNLYYSINQLDFIYLRIKDMEYLSKIWNTNEPNVTANYRS